MSSRLGRMSTRLDRKWASCALKRTQKQVTPTLFSGARQNSLDSDGASSYPFRHDERPRSQADAATRGGLAAPTTRQRPRSALQGSAGVLRRRGPPAGPLRDVARPSGRTRRCSRNLPAFRSQPSDVLQPTSEVLQRRDCGTLAEEARSEGTPQADNGGIGLRKRAPGKRTGALHERDARRDPGPIWDYIAPADVGEAGTGSSQKKKHRSLTPASACRSASKPIALWSATSSFATTTCRDQTTRPAPPAGSASPSWAWSACSSPIRLDAMWRRSSRHRLVAGDAATRATQRCGRQCVCSWARGPRLGGRMNYPTADERGGSL